MSKFSINNPAFLSMAGNVLSNSGVGTFYIEAIEDNTTISFLFQPFTSISTDDIEYVSAPDSKVLNAGEKIFIKIDTITEMTGMNPFTVDKQFNAGGNCPILNFVVDMDGETVSAFVPIIFSNTLIKDASNMVIDIESKTLTRGLSFKNCNKLILPPKLPAKTLSAEVYYETFKGCTSLTIAPELPATILTDYCYTSMFAQCTELVKITCLSTTNNATDATDGWVSGVSPTGTFIKAAGVEWTTGVDGIPEGWTVQEYAGNDFEVGEL